MLVDKIILLGKVLIHKTLDFLPVDIALWQW
jgi:hypothetical protein